MKVFHENDLVIGQSYFFVYNNIVHYGYADTSDIGNSGAILFRDDEHYVTCYAYQTTLIYQLVPV